MRQTIILSTDKTKILYITGWGRSGSTLLDNVLGSLGGFFSVGEVAYLWDRNILEGRICGCGVPVTRCDIWSEVLNKAYGGIDQAHAREMMRLRDSVVRTRYAPLMLVPGGERLLRGKLDSYIENLAKLYEAVRSEVGSRVIVDSSKLPAYAHLLRMIPDADVYVVHIVRDPRAVAYSWLRKKVQPDTGQLFDRHPPYESALVWNAWNVAAELLFSRWADRYLRIRYEDFVEKPGSVIGQILAMMGESAPVTQTVENQSVMLGVNHTVSGNPSRFVTGTVELRSDVEWEATMKRSDKVTVSALTWPLRVRYGYT